MAPKNVGTLLDGFVKVPGVPNGLWWSEKGQEPGAIYAFIRGCDLGHAVLEGALGVVERVVEGGEVGPPLSHKRALAAATEHNGKDQRRHNGPSPQTRRGARRRHPVRRSKKTHGATDCHSSTRVKEASLPFQTRLTCTMFVRPFAGSGMPAVMTTRLPGFTDP